MTTHDVAIIGGGPAGSTCGSLLRKYNTDLRVAILEKETFPREHVGESQLPLIGSILNEMGCWEKVEQAEFPIKLGATYRWGKSDELWDFEFIPFEDFRDEPRPATFQGQRMFTAFQVDRARYDEILLDHAASLGCDVRQATLVRTIERDGDRVTGLRTEQGDEITATHYVDASGGVGVLRRAMDVGVTHPGGLKNIAMWDYWENAEWAVTIGTGGTRVFVLSIGCGWIWFIPIGKTRVSIGFICPKEHWQSCGKSLEELYTWALAQEPLVQKHTANATREGEVRSTKDWSFISDRMVGENWYLAGESCGFADPILAGGMMLTHAGSRELAYTILELERGNHERSWLLERYADLQRRRMMQHIRFADFWYAGNGQFKDLESLTQAIATDAGIKLEPRDAFRWLSNGGFLEDIPGRAGLGGLDLAATKQVTGIFTGEESGVGWKINEHNVYKLNLQNAREDSYPVMAQGRIQKARCYVRESRVLPLLGHFGLYVEILKKHSDINDIVREAFAFFRKRAPKRAELELQQSLQSFEVMIIDGWVWGSLNPKKPRLELAFKGDEGMIHRNRDVPALVPVSVPRNDRARVD